MMQGNVPVLALKEASVRTACLGNEEAMVCKWWQLDSFRVFTSLAGKLLSAADIPMVMLSAEITMKGLKKLVSITPQHTAAGPVARPYSPSTNSILFELGPLPRHIFGESWGTAFSAAGPRIQTF